MQGKTCCFIGHGEIWGDRDQVFEALAEAVERHIVEHGVTIFLAGNYGAFDYMAARAVREGKARHPGVYLYLMLPYRPEKDRSLPKREDYDNFIYPFEMEGVPLKLAIPRLNRLMVEDSDYAIAYVLHSWGGAATTLEYAEVRQRKGLIRIENLARQPPGTYCAPLQF